MRGIRIGEVWTSDLQRAAKTAQILQEELGGRMRIDSRLRERSFGKFEGMAFRELSAELHKKQERDRVDAMNVRPPGGESLKDAYLRLKPVAQELFRSRENRIMVGHGASCALLIAHLVKGGVETSRAFRFGNTGVTEFIRRPDGLFQLVRYNDTSHLLAREVMEGDTDGSHR
jgi:broad specificity phosphatase PhoE